MYKLGILERKWEWNSVLSYARFLSAGFCVIGFCMRGHSVDNLMLSSKAKQVRHRFMSWIRSKPKRRLTENFFISDGHSAYGQKQMNLDCISCCQRRVNSSDRENVSQIVSFFSQSKHWIYMKRRQSPLPFSFKWQGYFRFTENTAKDISGVFFSLIINGCRDHHLTFKAVSLSGKYSIRTILRQSHGYLCLVSYNTSYICIICRQD